MNATEVRSKLQELALATPAIEAHTHVQDDLTRFTPEPGMAIRIRVSTSV